MGKNNDREVKRILKKANKLLYKGVKEETEQLLKSMFPKNINYEKYEAARQLFEEVLALDPENSDALYGIKACDDMQEQYLAVQHIGPPDIVDFETTDPLAILRTDKAKKMLPWEVRRMILDDLTDYDKRAVEYTMEVFSEQAKMARAKTREMIDAAVERVKNGEDADLVFQETKMQLEQYQEELHHGWKGHGPEIIEEAIEQLAVELGVE